MSPRKRMAARASKKQKETESSWLADVYEPTEKNLADGKCWLPMGNWAMVYEPKKKKKQLPRFRKNFRRAVGKKAKDVAMTRLEKALASKMIRLVLDVTAIVLNRAEEELDPGPSVAFVNNASAVVLSYRFCEQRSKNMTALQEKYIKNAAVVKLADCMDQMMEEDELHHHDHEEQEPIDGGSQAAEAKEPDADNEKDVENDAKDDPAPPNNDDKPADPADTPNENQIETAGVATGERAEQVQESQNESVFEKATENDDEATKRVSEKGPEKAAENEEPKRASEEQGPAEEGDETGASTDVISEETDLVTDEKTDESKENGGEEKKGDDEGDEKSVEIALTKTEESQEPDDQNISSNEGDEVEKEETKEPTSGSEDNKQDEPVSEEVEGKLPIENGDTDGNEVVGSEKEERGKKDANGAIKHQSSSIEDLSHSQKSGRAIILARVQRQLRSELQTEKIRPLAEQKIDEAFDVMEKRSETAVHDIMNQTHKISDSLHAADSMGSDHSSVMNSKLVKTIKKAASFDDNGTKRVGAINGTIAALGTVELNEEQARDILKKCGIVEPRLPDAKETVNQDLVDVLKAVIKANILSRLEEMSGWILFYLDQLFVAVTLANEVNKRLGDDQKRDTSVIIQERAEEINFNMEATIRQEVGNFMTMFDSMLDKKMKTRTKEGGDDEESGELTNSQNEWVGENDGSDGDDDQELLESIQELQ